MAHLLLYKKEQIAEPPKKNTGDFKHRESEDAELVFVGVEYVNEDDDILFVQVISKPKPVASKILNRATRDSEIKRGVLNQDPAHTLQTASHNTPRDAILLSQSECLAIDSPSLLQPSSHPGYEVRSLQVMHQNTSDLLSQGHCGTKVPVRDQDDPEELFILDIENENIKRPKLSDGILKKQYSVIAPPAISPKLNTNRPSEGIQNSSSYVQAGASYPWIYTHGKAHFSCMDPGRANRLEIQEEANFSSTTSENRAIVPNQENLIMLLHDFYYGQHKGDRKHPEQKIYKTFKCSSCLQILKNVKFMNHVSHHLELERQRVDSWEIHTNCRHCHRRFCTPFELQCHVESVHTAQEAVPLCKICELSFKTNQALLEHMKYNHKPGEMPYVCQVCNYRSSVFADVETHFKTYHNYTKNLLCLFCLKIFKTTSYMKHCWKHWNRMTFQCSKCRLQFLTFKEKKEHQTKDHQTFKKPKQLEGLPPETVVIIKTSVQVRAEGAASITVSITDTQPGKSRRISTRYQSART